MSYGRTTAFGCVAASSLAAILFVACGDDGANGKDGAQGIAGPAGPPGVPGSSPLTDGGGALSGACTTPCHTFSGVVDQWRFSGHSHPQENEIGTGACGNCHAIDGLQNRVANKAIIADGGTPATNVAQGHISYKAGNGSVAEISYAGASVIGRIHCTTCHDFNPTNDPHVTGRYVAGQAPLRVASGPTDTVFIEKSPTSTTPTGQSLQFRSANTCVFCHKSRKDVTAYVSDLASNAITSFRWGPHEGPQADIYSAQGAYHKAGKTYGTSEHIAIANKCVTCHMPPVAANGNVPDHTMKPSVATCTSQVGCHSQYTGTTFDILGGQTKTRRALVELETALNTAGLLTRSTVAPYAALTDEELADGQFHLDTPRPPQTLSGPVAGALYNYLLIARGRDMGAHNPRYTQQLLYDAIEEISGATPTSLARPQ